MSHLFIGIDIGGTKTAVSLGTESGSILWREQFQTKPQYPDVLDDIHRSVDRLYQELETEIFSEKLKKNGITEASARSKIQSVGISCGGPLDSKRGIIQSPPNLPNWDDVPVVEILEGRLGLPCFLENDANACALAEWYWGNGRGCRNLIFLTFGTGLGAGLILDGRLYSGTLGLAGEVGHLRMAEEGPLCYGKHGSWESFCSGSGLKKLYGHLHGDELSAKEICDLADSGDERAQKVIEISSRYLGRGLALLIDLFNPECIIIGSIFSRSEHLFRRLMEEEVEKEALPAAGRACSIKTAGLQESLGDMASLGVAINGEKITERE
ncbi:MAG: ROK family protein [Spirochaetia bacterium]|nr:ROK family protein [Spirochaetia bacterium]